MIFLIWKYRVDISRCIYFLDSQMSPKTDRHRPRYKKMETLDERDSVGYNVIETYCMEVRLIFFVRPLHDMNYSE